ncbi:MAG: putative quinol monooxygenase [Colwellia sp.]
MINLTATIQAKAGEAKQIKSALLDLVKLTHQEEGVIQYQLFIDSEDDHCFYMIEKWQSQEALEKHFASEHFQSFQRKNEQRIALLKPTFMKAIL